jgi:nucleotide-binding universal stress UspA family protein
MRSILVPLDGSRLSESALPIATALARAVRAEIVLVRAVLAEGLEALDPEAQIDFEAEAEAYLLRVADGLETAGVSPVGRRVIQGKADQVIAQVALQDRADLIVIATHGRSGVTRLLLGSVAERVIWQVTIPVVLTRGEPVWTRGREKLLVPLDGSPLSEAILPLAEQLGRALGLGVVLLHALEPLPPAVADEVTSRMTLVQERREAEMADRLARIGETFRPMGLRVQTMVRSGPPAHVILDTAEAEKVTLIAMVTHGGTGAGRLLLGSVAQAVLKASPVPLLLCRPAKSDHV